MTRFCYTLKNLDPKRLSRFPRENPLFPRDMSNVDHHYVELLWLLGELIPVGLQEAIFHVGASSS